MYAAELLIEVHEYFGISNKVSPTVTDNGSNFVKAFQRIGTGMNNDDSDIDIDFEDVDYIWKPFINRRR